MFTIQTEDLETGAKHDYSYRSAFEADVAYDRCVDVIEQGRKISQRIAVRMLQLGQLVDGSEVILES